MSSPGQTTGGTPISPSEEQGQTGGAPVSPSEQQRGNPRYEQGDRPKQIKVEPGTL
jgi:hypothetical protein